MHFDRTRGDLNCQLGCEHFLLDPHKKCHENEYRMKYNETILSHISLEEHIVKVSNLTLDGGATSKHKRQETVKFSTFGF